MSNTYGFELRDILKTAPHVEPPVAEAYLEGLIKICEDNVTNTRELASRTEYIEAVRKEINFHVRRLGCIGGSDMSAIYGDHMKRKDPSYKGGYYPFATVADVIRSKLCLTLPEPHGGDTERGTVLEPIAARKFVTKMKEFKLKPCSDSMAKLKSWMAEGGDPDHPWLAAAPDMVYVDKFNKRWLVDFKIPGEHEVARLYADSPPDYYKAQLAQYKYCLQKAGVEIDHTVLAPLSFKAMEVYVGEFEVSQEMTNNVLEAGDFVWGCVLRHEIPKWESNVRFSHAEDVSERTRRLGLYLTYVSKVSAWADKEAKWVKKVLPDLLKSEGIDLGDEPCKVRIPYVDVAVGERKKVNTAAIAADFKALGGNPEDPKYIETSTQTSYSIIRSKKTDYSPEIEGISELALGAVNSGLMDICDQYGFDQIELRETLDPSFDGPPAEKNSQQGERTSPASEFSLTP